MTTNLTAPDNNFYMTELEKALSKIQTLTNWLQLPSNPIIDKTNLNKNGQKNFYQYYIYILAEAKYYSIVHSRLFTVREVATNIQALTWKDTTDRDITTAMKEWYIKVYNDFCFWEDEDDKYNLYDSSLILKVDMDNADMHPLIQELLEDITNSNTADMEYILKWIGWKYLHPLSPMCSALVLKGWQWSGKGHIVTLMQTIFWRKYTKVNISPENFSSRFSSTDEHTLICELAEQWETDYKTLTTTSTKIKTLIMQNELQVERKYKDLETIQNHTAFIITSNKQAPLVLDDKSIWNRRYSFFQWDKRYDDIKGAQVRSVITDKVEVAKLLGYILCQWGDELKETSVYSPHKNDIKDVLEQSAGNEFQEFWNYLREAKMGELISHTQMRKDFENFCKTRWYAHDRLKSKLLRECPWWEVRPNNQEGEQCERHRLIQSIWGMISGGGLSKIIPQNQKIEKINDDDKKLVPVSLKELEDIF